MHDILPNRRWFGNHGLPATCRLSHCGAGCVGNLTQAMGRVVWLSKGQIDLSIWRTGGTLHKSSIFYRMFKDFPLQIIHLIGFSWIFRYKSSIFVGFFHEINHPAIGDPFMEETLIWLKLCVKRRINCETQWIKMDQIVFRTQMIMNLARHIYEFDGLIL